MISFHIENGLTEYCHFKIVPVYPDKVKVVLLVPAQTVAPPVTSPPVETSKKLTSSGLKKSLGCASPEVEVLDLTKMVFTLMSWQGLTSDNKAVKSTAPSINVFGG